MGTRAMVCVQSYANGIYELFYRHNDGNPDALGFELVCFLGEVYHDIELGFVKDLTPIQFIDRMVKALRLQPENRTVEDFQDAFLKVQGDLEYLYVLRLDSVFRRTRFDLYKTSNPYTKANFVFHVLGFYMMFAPQRIRDISEKMGQAELISCVALQAVAGFEKATEKQAYEKT